ncbi:hypothetical protein JYP52_21225 [Nitratireductor aquibiodomus]|uniref:hypothetical protein n=1 Tax=Nitratireductor TaxID=245876 RepID=UPI000DDFF9C0|nr:MULTISPECIES: hypothetical protein [Nitratireductor]MBN7763663.1 hypothetical protein [Nitratireductor aquibiodomus]
MNQTKPDYEAHPRLYKRCRQLVGDEEAARVLCTMVVKTAPNNGHGGIILEGEMFWLPSHIRKLELHKLMGAMH